MSTTSFSVHVFSAKRPDKLIGTIDNLDKGDSVLSLKRHVSMLDSSISSNRQSLRLEPNGKSLKDEQSLGELNLPRNNAQIFLKDLGPQISWKTVFMVEYLGPLLIYPIFYLRPAIIYGKTSGAPILPVVHLACICWTFHYAKRLLETQFVHRFSNATMPRANIFKNSGYYWGFCAFVSYFINHPLYSSPGLGWVQVAVGLVGFILSEMGNLSIHILLRNLRPPGTKVRKIPIPNGNPLTQLFNYVSCPNYTYEAYAWFFFSMMTQSLPAFIFTIAGFIQMSLWAKNKHRQYKKDFASYPRSRTAIIPFLL